jgi:hypothetical protein
MRPSSTLFDTIRLEIETASASQGAKQTATLVERVFCSQTIRRGKAIQLLP